MNHYYQDIIEEWKPAAIVAGAGLAFNIAAYALDSVMGGIIMGLATAGAGIASIMDEDPSDTWHTMAASTLVAIGTIYGASMTANERKVCFTAPPLEVTEEINKRVNDGPDKNMGRSEPNVIASQVIFETVGEAGEKLPYTTEPSIFTAFRDGGRVCAKVGRAAQRVFNTDGFDQVGATKEIVSRWTQRYTPSS